MTQTAVDGGVNFPPCQGKQEVYMTSSVDESVNESHQEIQHVDIQLFLVYVMK